MWFVICSAHDAPALWAYYGLRRRGLFPLRLVTAETLARSLRWEHRVDDSGASVSITLPDGSIIDSAAVRGVLNRLWGAPIEHLSVSPDHEYAAQELTAFFISWLHALPWPVINRATPLGLCGRWRHASEWVWLAAAAGLRVPSYLQSSDDDPGEKAGGSGLFPAGTPLRTVIVFEGEAFGAAAPHEILRGGFRLAELAETSLLGLEFAVDPSDEWTFAGATPMPDLRFGGEGLLDRMSAVLSGVYWGAQ